MHQRSISYILKKPFVRDVLSLSGGAAITQAIALGALPVLTRLYTPEDIGILSLFISVVSVLTVPASLKLEHAVMLPNREREAAHLVAVIVFNSFAFSFILFVVMAYFSAEIASALGNPKVEPWLYAIPLSVFLNGSWQGLQFWRFRQKQFRQVSSAVVSGASMGVVIPVVWGLLRILDSMLVAGLIIGQLMLELTRMFVLMFGWRSSARFFRRMSFKALWRTMSKRRALTFTLFISYGMATVYSRLPIFAIATMFSSKEVGFFGLAERAVGVPSTLIANAIGDVFRQRANVAYQETGHFSSLFIKTLAMTAFISAPLYIVGMIIAPDVFAVVFGSEWRLAGEYASILLVGGMFSFITAPVDKVAVIVGAHRYIFCWHLARLLGNLAVISIVYVYGLSIEWLLWAIVCLRITIYSVSVFVDYRYSRGGDGKEGLFCALFQQILAVTNWRMVFNKKCKAQE